MKKRNGQLAALLLAMVMILSFSTPLFAAGDQTFKDVPESAWYYGYVMMLYEKGIVKGFGDTGEFRPDNKLTRQQAAKMIVLAAGLDYQGKKADFPDVDKDGEMSPYIAALVTKGAVRGFLDGTFRPKDNVQRGHAAKMVALAFGLLEGDMDNVLTDLPNDADVKTAIKILESNGVVKGYDNTKLFKPEEEISRAQFSKILCIAMVVASIQKAEADPTPENIAAAQALVNQLPKKQDVPTQDYLQDRLDKLEEEEPPAGPVDPDPVQVTSISVDPAEMYLELGKTAIISAEVKPSNATNKKIKWSSDDEAIATVTGGVVTPVEVGKATITATTLDGGFEATCVVTVIPAISKNADVTAEDFGVMTQSDVIGYTVGFRLENTTASDVMGIQVTLLDSTDKVLATNTAAGLLEKYPNEAQLSAPFDVIGNFNYETDGCWNYSGWSTDSAKIPAKAKIEVTFKNGVIKTAENTNLTGDTEIFTKQVINITQVKGYDTLSAAITDAQSNDEILAKAGEYVENITIDKPLTIRGLSSDSTASSKPVISGNAKMTAGASGTEGAKTRLENFSFIVPDDASGTYDSLILESAKHIVIKDCDFDARGIFAHKDGLMFRGVQMNGSCSNVDLDGCTFKDGYYIAMQGNANNLTVTGSSVTNCESGLNIQMGNHLLVQNTEMEIVAKSPENNAYCLRFGSATGTPSGRLEIFGGKFILDKKYEGMPNSNKYASAIIIRAAVNGSLAIENAVIQGEVVDDSKLLNLEDVLGDNTFLHKTIKVIGASTKKIAVAYTVTFDKNGGDTEANPTSRLVGEGRTLRSESWPVPPVRGGRFFKSWNTKEDGSGVIFDKQTQIFADMTVYAQWAELEYVARIDDRYFTTLKDAVNAVKTNETITLLANSEGDAINIYKEDVSLILDLNGYTYTINGNIISSNVLCGIRVFKGKVLIRNGELRTGDNFDTLIHNNEHLTLDEVHLKVTSDNLNYPLNMSGSGTTILQGNTIIDKSKDNISLHLTPNNVSVTNGLTVDVSTNVTLSGDIYLDLSNPNIVKAKKEDFNNHVQIIIPTNYVEKVKYNDGMSGFEWQEHYADRSILKKAS